MKTILALCLLVTSAHAQQAFINMDQMMQTLPLGLKLKNGKQWQAQSATLANQVLGKEVIGQPVKLQFTFNKMESRSESAYGKVIIGHVKEPALVINGDTVDAVVHVYFTPDQLPLLGMTSTQRTETFTGKVARADFTNDGSVFNLDIIQAKVGQGQTPHTVAKGPPVQIISATYGNGSQQVDVTARVHEKIVLKRQMVVVNPQDLGSDPAPGQAKRFRVVYTKDGKRYEANYGDNEWALWESFWGPKDKGELKAWLPTAKWAGDLIFKADGTFSTPNVGSGTWEATGDRQLNMTWSPNVVIPCELHYNFAEIREQAGMKTVWKRAP